MKKLQFIDQKIDLNNQFGQIYGKRDYIKKFETTKESLNSKQRDGETNNSKDENEGESYEEESKIKENGKNNAMEQEMIVDFLTRL